MIARPDSYTVASGGDLYAGIGAPAPAPAAPVAEFIASPLSGTTPLAVTFTDQSTGSITSRAWTFGDGNTSTATNPTNAYLTAGTFAVALTVTGPGGSNTRTRTAYVTSSAPTPPPPPPPSGTTITSLQVVSTDAGTYPYSATVLPLRGQVPAGSNLQSPTDATMRGSILSTHDDGSAAVVVVAGSVTVGANATSSIVVQTGTPTAGTALTPAAISALVSSVSVAFDGGYGTATVTDFSTPERTWWANAQTICARYRVAAPTPGSTALEAVIDVQAWATGRALVEVTVENAKMTTATPTKPAAASYSAAVVSVNGSAIATVNGNGAPEGNHAAFRAWTVRGWVGGDPGLRVTQAHTDLQKHPLLFQVAAANTADLSTYAADAYTPWSTGRQRATNMGAGGDHASIGPLPQWGARALQSGDHRAWNAVEVSDLACIGYSINYRDTSTGFVPTLAQLDGKSQQSNWPTQTGPDTDMTWKDSHHPAAGLMGFLSRPSPVFIELAQKVAVWNGTWSTSTSGGPAKPTGVFVAAYQMRGWAWGMRSLGHATFLTPDGMAWKAAGQTSIAQNVAYFDEWRTDGQQTALAVMWANRVGNPIEVNDLTPSRVNFKPWQYNYFLIEMAKIASARVAGASNQAALDTFTDWALQYPVKWINDQATTGAWRHVPEMLVLGAALETAPAMTNAADWATQRATWMTESPPSSVSGIWKSSIADTVQTYATGWADDNSAAALGRASYQWPALVAAVERGVTGAAAAWAVVQAGITNLSDWLDGFGTDPRYGSTPKVLPPPVGFAAGAATGTLVGDVWTPARTGDTVNGASWAIVPTGRWISVAGTAINGLQTAINAAIPGWSSYGPNTYWDNWVGSWSGICPDESTGRMWFGPAGGHTNGTNNGLYEFSAYKMAWGIEHLPSDPATLTTAYKTNFGLNDSTVDPDAGAAYDAQFAAGTVVALNGSFYDQTPAPILPTPRHTYESLVYVAGSNELYMHNRRQWRYSLTTHQWTSRRLLMDAAYEHTATEIADNDATPKTYLEHENHIAVYDEVAQQIRVSALGSNWAGNGRHLRYSVATGDWVSGSAAVGSYPGSDFAPWQRHAQCSARNGRTVTFFQFPFANDGGTSNGRDGWYATFNLDFSTYTESASEPSSGPGFQFGGGLSRASFKNLSGDSNSAGAVYVPAINRYWLVSWNAASVPTIWEINPTTAPWTISPGPVTGSPPPYAAGSKPTRHMMFVPAMNAVVALPSGTADMRIYKF